MPTFEWNPKIQNNCITAGLLLLSVYYLKSVLPFYVESNNTEQHLDATKTAADCSPVIW